MWIIVLFLCYSLFTSRKNGSDMVWPKIDHISHQIGVVISGALNHKVLYMVVNPIWFFRNTLEEYEMSFWRVLSNMQMFVDGPQVPLPQPQYVFSPTKMHQIFTLCIKLSNSSWSWSKSSMIYLIVFHDFLLSPAADNSQLGVKYVVYFFSNVCVKV